MAIIGKSLAQARGLLPKPAIKQVDRLLSHSTLDAWDVFATGVPEMVGARTKIVVAMDWTDYEADGQATLALTLVTRHGRATPLMWLSVLKDELTQARNADEEACLRRLAAVLPERYWIEINERLVPFGKFVCTGERPRCGSCLLLRQCRQVGVVAPRGA